MVSTDEILLWLNGEAPSAEVVDALKEEAPWWLLPPAMRLRNARDLDESERTALTSRLAVAAPDAEQMALAADSDLSLDLAGFYPIELPSTPDTSGTIEKFLTTYGSPSAEEDALLERLIFNPTPDYAQLLSREEEHSLPQAGEAPEGSPDELINSFIIKSKARGDHFALNGESPDRTEPPKPEAPVRKPMPDADSSLSEALAQAYIKKGKYSKAYEIINDLNLNFPEKSIYFADQLRFLGKLIAIEERKSMLKK